MTGGKTEENKKSTRDILVYDANKDKWTKVGDLCRARYRHAISLAPAIVEDECIVDIDCFGE